MPKVTIDVDKCKGCLLCNEVCPKKILKPENDKPNVKGYYPTRVVDVSKCIGCMRCALMCPDCVITIEK